MIEPSPAGDPMTESPLSGTFRSKARTGLKFLGKPVISLLHLKKLWAI
jgi:hypothetical protein